MLTPVIINNQLIVLVCLNYFNEYMYGVEDANDSNT